MGARTWIERAAAGWVVWGCLAQSGCIRWKDDAPAAAALDASSEAASGNEAGKVPDAAGEAAVSAVSLCKKYGGIDTVRAVVSDVVSEFLADCRIQQYFALPPVRLLHFQECLTLQVASIMGCEDASGARVKYPGYDSQGQFCRDMKTSHQGMGTSEGDFGAIVDDVVKVLQKAQVADEDIAALGKVLLTTQDDIVEHRDAGPTKPCKKSDAGAPSDASPADASLAD